MNSSQLLAIMPLAKAHVAKFLEPLNAAMEEFDINTPLRQAAFIAQLAHESGQFRYVRELASGAAYEGRKDLGNTKPGDGVRYRGRGLIQITGRANYASCGQALGANFIDQPELLEQPQYATKSACWFWKDRGLNELADAGEFEKITRRINGGLNGLADRKAFYFLARQVLV